jgi:hypothetical protein
MLAPTPLQTAARATCVTAGVTQFGQSDFFNVVANGGMASVATSIRDTSTNEPDPEIRVLAILNNHKVFIGFSLLLQLVLLLPRVVPGISECYCFDPGPPSTDHCQRRLAMSSLPQRRS